MPAVAAPHAMPESLIPVLSDSMAVRPAPPAARASAASIPTLNVSAPPAATPAPAIAAPAPAAPVFPAAAPVPQAAKSPQPGTVTVPAAATPPPVAATPPPRRIEAMGTPLMSLDMTQTLRPLTPTELEDASVLRWFVIQLSCSEKAFDPDALPYLDIFTEYRLYSVSGLEQGKLMHALRLGFFSEESHAKAVAGYLGTFYENPLIKRVSAAERTRFAQHRVEARKDIGATGRHAIIEITDQRVIRPKRSGNPAAPPAMSPPPPPARGR
jgi:hypothetical protein